MLGEMFAEIDARVRALEPLGRKERERELRLLRAKYHPDKASPGLENLYTLLSQQLNSLRLAHAQQTEKTTH